VTQGFTGTTFNYKVCTWNQSARKNLVPETEENVQQPDHLQRKIMEITVTATGTEAIQHLPSPEMADLAMIPAILNGDLATEESRYSCPA